MRTVFFGSGAFGIPCLEALVRAGHEVSLVVAQPDRERGRGRALGPPALKVAAQSLALPVFQPPRIKAPDALEVLRPQAPELQVVVAYGQILPRTVIDLAPLGTVNVHASLLPRYRGAAPIQWAIANGEQVTGVTTMLIDEGLDTGPILLAADTAIGPEETTEELEARLSRLGAEVLLRTIDGLGQGTLKAVPQDDAAASLAPLIEKSDGRIDWSRPAVEIARRVRAFHVWPGTFTTLRGRTLKVLRARPAQGAAAQGAAPGRVVAIGAGGFAVACGNGTALEVLEVQPESRRPMTADAFLRGARLSVGAQLD